MSRQFQFCSRQFQFAHGNFNFTHGNFNLLTAISICSRQFQFARGNFNYGNFNFTHGDFNILTRLPTRQDGVENRDKVYLVVSSFFASLLFSEGRLKPAILKYCCLYRFCLGFTRRERRICTSSLDKVRLRIKNKFGINIERTA